MEYNQDLDNQFKELGFDNYGEFYKTAFPWSGLPADKYPPGSVYVMEDLYTDKDNVEFIFEVAKKGDEENKWLLQAIDASVQMDSDRVIEGVIVVGRVYKLQNGSLPNKEQIKDEVLEKVRIEALKERFFQQQQLSARQARHRP